LTADVKLKLALFIIQCVTQDRPCSQRRAIYDSRSDS